MASNTSAVSAKLFRLIAQQVNANSKPISPIKHTGVIHGGFPYHDFNGEAKIKPEAILNAIECARSCLCYFKTCTNPDSFLDCYHLCQDHLVFINAASFQVSEKLYDRDVVKGPVHYSHELAHVGNTSFQIKTGLFFEDDMAKPAVVGHISSVLVSNETGKPVAPPKWWLGKYRDHVEGGRGGRRPLGRIDLSGGDESQSTESEFCVDLSDIDPYQHTNWSKYLKFCHSAFGNHQIRTIGRRGGYEHYFRRSVKDFSIRYLKQSMYDDKLTVKVTPETSLLTNDVFYFSLFNKDKDIICQSKIQYYPLKTIQRLNTDN